MSIEIHIPELGEGIEKGDIVAVMVAVGDTVSEGQALLEMETGKATVEIPSPQDGTIEAIHVAEGDNKGIGDLVCTLDSGDAAPAAEEPAVAAAPAVEEATPAASVPPPAPAASAAPVEQDLVVPNLGEGIDAGEVVNILVAVGDEVEEGQSLLELETGKATVEIPSENAGTIRTITATEGAKLVPGDVIGSIMATGSAPAATAAPATSTAAKASAPAAAPAKAAAAAPAKLTARKNTGPLIAAPSVRKFAREIGVDISAVPGSGARGRISIADVKAWSRQLHTEGNAGATATGGGGIKPAPLPDFSVFGSVREDKMSTIRKMTKDHMATCWGTIPHVTNFDEADVTELEKLRKSFGPKAEARGGKLTITAITMKVLASALKAFPQFNASIDAENETVFYKDYVNIGIAVDTPKGLVVPVIRDVDQKNMIEIAVELMEISTQMRDGKINPKMLQGGCITFTNLGGLHGKFFTPIVNAPEVAILGMGRAQMKPVYVNGQFEPRLMAPLSLSYDHRLIDGADGARFMKWIVDALEQPLLISLEG